MSPCREASALNSLAISRSKKKNRYALFRTIPAFLRSLALWAIPIPFLLPRHNRLHLRSVRTAPDRRSSSRPTWLNATDLVVRAGIYWFIEKHPEAGIMDLLNFCMEQEFECGLVFDGNRKSAGKIPGTN